METLDRKAARRPLPFLLALLLCLCMAACADGSGDDREAPDEITGSDWRVTGIVRDSGAVTRNGEDTFVLVCVNAADAAFYYDTEDQTFFDAVEYPITLVFDIIGINVEHIGGIGGGCVGVDERSAGGKMRGGRWLLWREETGAWSGGA